MSLYYKMSKSKYNQTIYIISIIYLFICVILTYIPLSENNGSITLIPFILSIIPISILVSSAVITMVNTSKFNMRTKYKKLLPKTRNKIYMLYTFYLITYFIAITFIGGGLMIECTNKYPLYRKYRPVYFIVGVVSSCLALLSTVPTNSLLTYFITD